MTKILNKWFRKFHRWIAVPTALAIPAVVVIKLVGDPRTVAVWEKLDKIPSILILIMAISGPIYSCSPTLSRDSGRKNWLHPRQQTSSHRRNEP
jgi:hypothetical protein